MREGQDQGGGAEGGANQVGGVVQAPARAGSATVHDDSAEFDEPPAEPLREFLHRCRRVLGKEVKPFP